MPLGTTLKPRQVLTLELHSATAAVNHQPNFARLCLLLRLRGLSIIDDARSRFSPSTVLRSCSYHPFSLDNACCFAFEGRLDGALLPGYHHVGPI